MNVVDELRAHNRWRLGGDGPATDARRLTALIAAACAELESRDKDAERYRYLRRKFAIIGNGGAAEFHALNLPPPAFVAPDPAAELDAVIDAAIGGQ